MARCYAPPVVSRVVSEWLLSAPYGFCFSLLLYMLPECQSVCVAQQQIGKDFLCTTANTI